MLTLGITQDESICQQMAISIIINTAILNIANQHQSTSIKTHD
jgi:hypothetical protein